MRAADCAHVPGPGRKAKAIKQSDFLRGSKGWALAWRPARPGGAPEAAECGPPPRLSSRLNLASLARPANRLLGGRPAEWPKWVQKAKFNYRAAWRKAPARSWKCRLSVAGLWQSIGPSIERQRIATKSARNASRPPAGLALALALSAAHRRAAICVAQASGRAGWQARAERALGLEEIKQKHRR